MKHTYTITGMSCSGCKNSVEEAIGSMSEVTKVVADIKNAKVEIEMKSHISIEKFQETLLMSGLHYTIEDSEVKKNVHSLKFASIDGNGVFYCPMFCEGEKTYHKHGDCPICGMPLVEQPSSDNISGNQEDKQYVKLLKKMKIAVLFTVPIFIIAMADVIPGNPLSKILHQSTWNWIEFLLSLPVVFYAAWMFFKRAYKSIVTWNLNMFTLIGIGAGIAFLFSIFGMLFPNLFPDDFKTDSGTVYVYFEAVTVILTLVLLGQLLEAKAHRRTGSAIKELMGLAPTDAILVTSKGDKIISVNDIKKGNLLRVKPGGKIPVDGIITEGEPTIDESMITGESVPVDKYVGDKVSSGTINGNKSFVMIAEKVGSETLLAQIIEMVNKASRSRAPIQKLADKISKYFVPTVIIASVITFLVWIFLGGEHAVVFAFVNAIAVLVIACPCALGLATPMSVMVGVGKGAKNGILIKDAEALEKLAKINVLITDKTGTLTEGKPSVEKIKLFSDKLTENECLRFVGSVNQYSEHPLADAIVKFAKKNNVTLSRVENFEAVAGSGLVGIVDDVEVIIGNRKMLQAKNVFVSERAEKEVVAEQKKGKTVSYIVLDKLVVGCILIFDEIKKSSKKAIELIQNAGIEVIMLSGDNKNTAKRVAENLNLKDFKAEYLPEDKLKFIKKLQEKGLVVAMTGDGINDAPALAQADVGIAMGTGTDVAMKSSEITLVKGDLLGIAKAVNLSKAVMKNIKQNLFFAFIYNVVGIPIAAGVLYPVFGVLLSPMIAATAMSFSSVSVISNSLRLSKVKLNTV